MKAEIDKETELAKLKVDAATDEAGVSGAVTAEKAEMAAIAEKTITPAPSPTPVDPDNPGDGSTIALIVIVGLEAVVLVVLIVALILVNRRKV